MSGKTKKPCAFCGKGIAIHRGKRVCGESCSAQLRKAKRQQLTDPTWRDATAARVRHARRAA